MVSAGPNIANVSTGCIPEYYKTVRVTAISENVFANVNTMEKLEIPTTIQRIGVGALPVYASSKRQPIVFCMQKTVRLIGVLSGFNVI